MGKPSLSRSLLAAFVLAGRALGEGPLFFGGRGIGQFFWPRYFVSTFRLCKIFFLPLA